MTDQEPKRRGNPAMVKGAASVNPAGRGAPNAKPFSEATKAKARAAGSDGVTAYAGYVHSGESNSSLTGAQKWVTYTNSLNTAVVATGVRYFGNLLAGTKWNAVPNPLGGKLAERGAEIVRQGLLDAPLARPWPIVVRKAAMFRMLGFSLHATAIARRRDGMVVYTAIEHRDQHTIEKWNRTDERSPFETVTQRTRSGAEYLIPLTEALYCFDDTLTSNPEGVGLLRHVVELVRRLGIFEPLEGKAFQEDMGGMPLAFAPLSEIAAAAGTTDPAEIATFTAAATSTLRAAVDHRVKTPETPQWLMLDSATYQGADPDRISNIRKWGIELLKTETKGLADLDRTIRRVEIQIARVLGIEFALVGGNDSAGTYGMHADKTSMFGANLETTLSEVGIFATAQLARRLVAANGLDPDTCTPTVVADPISTEAIEVACAALANLNKSGLLPGSPQRNVMLARMRLPPEEETAADLLAPRRPAPKPDDVDDIEDDDEPKTVKPKEDE